MVIDQNYLSDSTPTEQEDVKETIGRLLFPTQHFKRKVKRLERDIKSLETELKDLDKCVDRETLVDLIHEIPSKESDSVKRIVIKKSEDIPHALAPLAKQ
ncbi:hypothetical protein C1646_774531 [Rhizophagus diaphanus]|nr:hypothetical protein C1646_774531 [Rhizophagus diaphanus] [Rhizophagus sp. MUCL 43196]